MYDALRALEAKAKAAHERQKGQKYSRREAARKAEGPESTLDRRLAEWLPEEWGDARTPDPSSGEQLMAVVTLWSSWAGVPCDDSRWRTLLDEAQPPRPPARRRDPAHVGAADGLPAPLASDQVDYPHLQEQVEDLRARVAALHGHVHGVEDTKPRLLRRVDRLLELVQTEERRADQERGRRVKERKRRKQAERRVEEAERQTEEAAAEVTEARRQLFAAAEYARNSDALLETQREQLRQLRQEIKVLRGQVRELTEEHRGQGPKNSAERAVPVGAATVRSRLSAVQAQTGGSGRRADETLNDDAPWDAFDPHEYSVRNYALMSREDAEIVSRVRDHFSDHFQGNGRAHSGIDVGAGGNLYPALAMLPWAENITLLERSPRNLDYLRGQRDAYHPHWDQFWGVLCEEPAYALLDVPPRERFRQAVHLQQGSLFDLGDHPGRWDVGTMFFVAESITASRHEFLHGAGCFMRSLAPGAPFAAAFMEHSHGYHVGDVEFPACAVDYSDVEEALDAYAQEMKTYRIEDPGSLVRDGYSGLILVCGRRHG
ncbi:SCO2525 family SAM-dependent methyltransferase [Streptomyces sp. NPDC002623]